jgi:prepilin-type N-terminal cleavage/methylation domain-containing protein
MSTSMSSLSKIQRRVLRAQAGFTIVEMMVAVTISLFVIMAFAATFVNMKTTFNSQSGL